MVQGSREDREPSGVANDNGNGNGGGKLVSLLPTVLSVIVTVFFGIAALLFQAMRLNSENVDLKLKLIEQAASYERKLIIQRRDFDAVRLDVVEDRLNRTGDTTTVIQKKEP